MIAPEPAAQKAWMDAQKDALKTGGLDKALQALARHFEAAEVDDDQAPVRRCHRYLIGRRNQLNYREALANDLPIGSGEIESAHRYIAQLRLKRPGALWAPVGQKQLARRKSELATPITKSRSVIASLWIAPRDICSPTWCD